MVLASAIRVVPEFQRMVIFRLGRCIGQKGPGLVIIISLADRCTIPAHVDGDDTRRTERSADVRPRSGRSGL